MHLSPPRALSASVVNALLVAACVPATTDREPVVDTRETACWEALSPRGMLDRSSSVFSPSDTTVVLDDPDSIESLAEPALRRMIERRGSASSFVCVTLPDETDPSAALIGRLNVDGMTPIVARSECQVNDQVTHAEFGGNGIVIEVEAICFESSARALLNVEYAAEAMDSGRYTFDSVAEDDRWVVTAEELRAAS